MLRPIIGAAAAPLMPSFFEHQALDRRQPDHGGPDCQQRAESEEQAHERVEPQLFVEQLQRHEAEEFAVLGAGCAGFRGERATSLAHRLEMLGFDHAAADQQKQQRWGYAGEEHITPAKTADQRVNLAADDAPHRPAGHHDTEHLSAVDLGEGFGHQRDADDDFGSRADPGEEAIDPKFEGRVRQSL